MNRNESFFPSQVTTLKINLAWAPLEMISDDVEEIQVLLSGNDEDVADMKLSCSDGLLLLEQPTYGLSCKLNMVRWMQAIIRVPHTWRGSIVAGTISGALRARALSGADMTFETVTGDLRVQHMSAIDMALRSVSGCISASAVNGEKCSIRTVSGDAELTGAAFAFWRANTVSGRIALDMAQPFTQLEGTTVSGDMTLSVPVDQADAALRSIGGRMRTSGVSIQPNGPRIAVNSVSGNLEINCNLQTEEE